MRRCPLLCTAFFLAAVGPIQPAGAADKIFSVTELASRGRVVTAHFADFDGDRRTDVMVATLNGIPPDESRQIHVYLQSNDGSFSETPSHSVPIPTFSAVYDIADLKHTPGEELIVLRPDGVTVLSLADARDTHWDLPVDAPSTIGASDDERGFDPFRMVYTEFGDQPWILVPQIGVVSAVTADGSLQAVLNVGRRANYFVPKRDGLLSVESDIQLYLDVPKISVGDVDGNGLADLIAATRHEIRVFLRGSDGRFPRQPSYAVPLKLIGQRDHSRGTGSVVATAQDIDGDERLDLMVTHVEGSFVDTVTTTYIYRNRHGRWDIGEPDERFVTKGALSSDLLMNIDRDETPELVRIQFRFSVLEVVEMLLTREVDAEISIHRLTPDGRYGAKPWSKKKIGTGISFETFRPKGFMPRAGLDLNADGLMDFIASANGKGIEVYLGGSEGPFARRTAIQRLPTAGVIRFADVDGDDLPDFLLYDPQTIDSPVKIGRNLGTLPGTPGPAD